MFHIFSCETFRNYFILLPALLAIKNISMSNQAYFLPKRVFSEGNQLSHFQNGYFFKKNGDLISHIIRLYAKINKQNNF